MGSSVVAFRVKHADTIRHAPHPEDDIFFTKEQIVRGIELQHCGRLDPGSIWVVTNIRSQFAGKVPGNYSWREVPAIRHLSDEITLRRVGGRNGEIRTATFQYMSYSAIWRIV